MRKRREGRVEDCRVRGRERRDWLSLWKVEMRVGLMGVCFRGEEICLCLFVCLCDCAFVCVCGCVCLCVCVFLFA